MISIRRQALIANGLLTLCAGLLALVPVSREAGQVLTMLMGCSLIFSGLLDYCGWERILRWFFPVGAERSDQPSSRSSRKG
ncbi:MAG: hypothetical protein ACOVRM_05560 [Planctomycetaceae bacterium]|jgi:uncharacterized membrane protein HdeD (DUF308 family)